MCKRQASEHCPWEHVWISRGRNKLLIIVEGCQFTASFAKTSAIAVQHVLAVGVVDRLLIQSIRHFKHCMEMQTRSRSICSSDDRFNASLAFSVSGSFPGIAYPFTAKLQIQTSPVWFVSSRQHHFQRVIGNIICHCLAYGKLLGRRFNWPHW